MSDTASVAPVGPQLPEETRAALRLIGATGSTDRDLAHRLAGQVAESLWLPSDLSAAEKQSRIEAALATLEGIAPRGALEGLLASQMVATHQAAMECLRRAMIEGQPSRGRDANLRHGAKLMALFAQQLEALERQRGRGRHRVTVEHVRIAQIKTQRRYRAEE
ncbi:MAG: hypothetical protein AAF495_22660 [Pseudomonadota bacterium]